MDQKQKGTEKSKGQVESEISEAIIKFEKEYMGRGPAEAKTYIIDDLVLVRLKGILTQAEYQLARAEDDLPQSDEKGIATKRPMRPTNSTDHRLLCAGIEALSIRDAVYGNGYRVR